MEFALYGGVKGFLGSGVPGPRWGIDVGSGGNPTTTRKMLRATREQPGNNPENPEATRNRPGTDYIIPGYSTGWKVRSPRTRCISRIPLNGFESVSNEYNDTFAEEGSH